MALNPLTRVQQATVLALVEARSLDVVPADFARATSFLRQAEERLNQLPRRESSTVCDVLATRAATRRSRWVPRRRRRPSRSPERCSTPSSPEGSRRDPAVRKQSVE